MVKGIGIPDVLCPNPVMWGDARRNYDGTIFCFYSSSDPLKHSFTKTVPRRGETQSSSKSSPNLSHQLLYQTGV